MKKNDLRLLNEIKHEQVQVEIISDKNEIKKMKENFYNKYITYIEDNIPVIEKSKVFHLIKREYEYLNSIDIFKNIYLIQDDASSDIIVKFKKFRDLTEILAYNVWGGHVYLTDFETFGFEYDPEHMLLIVSKDYIKIIDEAFRMVDKEFLDKNIIN